jgi:S-adenosylmethionine:tRNA ribosyltransferase-isomerase
MAFLDFSLPKELIAQTPAQPRDHSRLMVLLRDTGRIEHRHFYDLPDYLNEGDVLVLNDTRVLPARLRGHKKDTGGRVEALLLKEEGDGLWRAMVRPGKRLPVGARAVFGGLEAEVAGREPDGTRLLRFPPGAAVLEAGQVPLPPYIHIPLRDPERYQTVFARKPGGLAAPTAGLHFTPELLGKLKAKGVETVFVTLHIGPGSFRPVGEGENLPQEYGEISPQAARALTRARKEGRRFIAVGTTCTRLLEQAATEEAIGPYQGWTWLVISPGHTFRAVSALVTNFHLPRSTHLLLVNAFCGEDLVKRAYEEAIRLRYRFYSFGDCMVIV